MAGEMTPEQWGFISDGLKKISQLCEETIPELSKQIALNNKETQGQIDLINRDIQGNGVKGLKQLVYEHEDKIDELEKKPEPKIPKPVFSGKQVLAQVATVLLVAGFMTGFFSFRIDDQSNRISDQTVKISKLEDKIDKHILNP